MPSTYELRNLALVGAFGSYYCRVFQGNPEMYISEYWSNIRVLFSITDQESSDPVLDSIGQYYGRSKLSLAKGCTWHDKGIRDSIYQVLFVEWAKQNLAGRNYFPFSYHELGI